MSKVLAIALNTFREAVRNKILYFLLIFALMIMGFSTFLSDLSIAAPEKLIKDLGLASIEIFGFLIAVFVGVYLVYNELDKKTIYTIVSKPIDRYQFILGKYFGLLITIYVNVVIMSIFFFSVLYYRENTVYDLLMKAMYDETAPGQYAERGNLTWIYYKFYFGGFVQAVGQAVLTLFGYSTNMTVNLMPAIYMSALGLAILTSFAIFYSTFSTPTLSAVFTFLTYIIGSLCEDILRYAERLAQNVGGSAALTGADAFKYWFAQVAMHVTPNLALFDKRLEAVYSAQGTVTMSTLPALEWNPIDPLAVVYGAVYVVGVLSIACMIFNRRNFK